MSSSLATQNATVAAPLVSGSSQSSHLGVGRSAASSNSLVLHPLPSQFREIHKNTWLKRLTAEGKKITVGAKKSEKNWVVFCVHDDSVALLEGYSEPRQTGAHMPEWVISLQDTLHISHALIPNSHEFEFVVTLSNEVIRFHAMSWDIMQEWVTTLRSKLREMKILSPKENLYTKLPEVRAPLLPTRDPTSPLPAPPPVPAAIVPGVERVIPQSAQLQTQELPSTSRSTAINCATNNTTNNSIAGATIPTSSNESPTLTADTNISTSKEQINHVTTSSTLTQLTSGFSSSTPNITSMSNTLSQNLLNMLSDPITAYSEQINESSTISNNEDSGSDDLNLSDDEFLSPILRKSCAQILQNDNSSRNVDTYLQRSSADHIRDIESLLQCDRLIPRPQTSRSQSVGSGDKTKKSISVTSENEQPSLLTTNDHITDIEINHQSKTILSNPTSSSCNNSALLQNSDSEKNVTIIQVSTNNDKNNQELPPELPAKTISGDIFKFPETTAAKTSTTKISSTKTRIKQSDYKSNVQIIPSNMNTNNSTIHVLNQDHENLLSSNISSSPKLNDYTIPIKSSIAIPANTKNVVPSSISSGVSSMVPTTSSKVTTVHVTTSKELSTPLHNGSATSVSVYGTFFTSSLNNSSQSLNSSPKLPKKIILSANTSGITSISVNNNVEHSKNTAGDTSDKNTLNPDDLNVRHNVGNIHYEKVFLSSSIPTLEIEAKETPLQNQRQPLNTPNQQQTEQTSTTKTNMNSKGFAEKRHEEESSSMNTAECHIKKSKTPKSPPKKANKVVSTNKGNTPSHSVSPALRRRQLISPNARQSPFTNNQNSVPQESHRRMPLLTRGLTEAAILTRHSRKDLYNLKLASAFKASSKTNSSLMFNNNEESSLLPGSSNNSNQSPLTHPLINRTNSELTDQRRRSSSTSDAQTPRGKVLGSHSNTNNNDLTSSLVGSSPALRIQQPPLPFRSSENGVCNMKSAPVSANNSPIKRLTIREQQVMQIRREIMHPGGVRLQLRRKDCIGSIAWVEAFGAVWIAGWKQKEHPVLYNALHIGDQLITIAGISINSPVEANKVIRNTNTLFVEVLVRRIPFGRAYAIRREREGQCLGLIRDGNSATIVDVVPNSLAARHGLPPKAQSCDGSTLTFWVLTEINGRPLNLFFKDNEIRDRLNSVGRDISILVQPSDLIAKLRKQLKSLRGYKDYLVQ